MGISDPTSPPFSSRTMTTKLLLLFLPLTASFVSRSFPFFAQKQPQRLKEHQLHAVPPVQVVRSMPDPLPRDLKNKYYLLRHGQSTANVAEIISSSRSLAYTDKHGLTALGYEQGKASAVQLLDILQETAQPGDKVILVSSPFARAYQTALACLDGLQEEPCSERVRELGLKIVDKPVLNDNLVERYFGRLDAEAIYTYAYVWPLDLFNTTHTAFDVESVAAVCTRLRTVVEQLEKEYDGCHLVWVSHADVLQIAQLYAAEAPNVGVFSSYRFKNGEVREMVVGSTDKLGDPVPLLAPERTIDQVKPLPV